MVRVRYVGTLFELKIPVFLLIAPAFLCGEAKDSWSRRYKCVNWGRWFTGKWFQSQLKLRVVKIKDGSTVRYVSIFAKRYGTVRFFIMVRVRYVGTVRFKIELKYGTLVRYGSRCEVRSTEILNAPYRTAILGLDIVAILSHLKRFWRTSIWFGNVRKAFLPLLRGKRIAITLSRTASKLVRKNSKKLPKLSVMVWNVLCSLLVCMFFYLGNFFYAADKVTEPKPITKLTHMFYR